MRVAQLEERELLEVRVVGQDGPEERLDLIARGFACELLRRERGAPVELDEARGGTAGEAFLFGCVLDELYGAQVTLNAMAELHVVLHPSKTEFRWPARSGRRAIR
jgi:type VI protein secretion system component VasA